jgi:hypothetical protein
LDTLDDENHVLIYTVLGGDHRLKVYPFLVVSQPLYLFSCNASTDLNLFVGKLLL